MAQADPKRNIRFGKYTLIDRIAVGGMAEIFLARQAGIENFEKTIVIKRIRPHLSKQPNFVKMFLNEAKLSPGDRRQLRDNDRLRLGSTTFVVKLLVS